MVYPKSKVCTQYLPTARALFYKQTSRNYIAEIILFHIKVNYELRTPETWIPWSSGLKIYLAHLYEKDKSIANEIEEAPADAKAKVSDIIGDNSQRTSIHGHQIY